MTARACARLAMVIVATVLVAAGPAGARPARAATDLPAVMLDTPSGFVVARAEVGYTGPMDEKGEPLRPGRAPDPVSGMVSGHMKTWMREPNTGEVVVVMAGEFSTPEVAAVSAAQEVKEGLSEPGASTLAVPGIPEAQGVVVPMNPEGIRILMRAVIFSKGPFVFAVMHGGLHPGPSPQAVFDLARAQYEKAPASPATSASDEEPVDPAAAAQPAGDERADPTPGLELSYQIGRVAAVVVVAVALALVIQRLTRRRGPAVAPTVPRPVQWGADDFGMSAPHPRPSPPAPEEHGPWAKGAAVREPSDPTASSVIISGRPCPACSSDFGPGGACAACGTPRTTCLVCGTAIYPGAVTCRDHSRVLHR